MKTVAHTPGPWEAEPDGARDWKVRSEDYGTIVDRVCYPDAKVDTTVEADARLIAAAPELLAACQWTVAAFGELARDGNAMNVATAESIAARLSAAIAKATGGDA